MMADYLSDELCFFAASLVSGVTGAVLFDFFRSLRKGRGEARVRTSAEDILLWLGEVVIVFYTVYKFNYGGLRLYFFAGFAIGFVLYLLTLSRWVLCFMYGTRKILWAIMCGIWRAVCRVVSFLTLPFAKIYKFLYNYAQKTHSRLKKLKKQLKMY